MTSMHAISLWQPWASLIALGVKTIETRSWPAPEKCLGERIAIHAAKRSISQCLRDVPEVDRAELLAPFSRLELKVLPLGAVVATATLDRCSRSTGIGGDGWIYAVETDGVVSGYRRVCRPDAFGDYTADRYLWELKDIEPIDPAPASGRQGIWTWRPTSPLRPISSRDEEAA